MQLRYQHLIKEIPAVDSHADEELIFKYIYTYTFIITVLTDRKYIA